MNSSMSGRRLSSSIVFSVSSELLSGSFSDGHHAVVPCLGFFAMHTYLQNGQRQFYVVSSSPYIGM
jgi:hypothetical protein